MKLNDEQRALAKFLFDFEASLDSVSQLYDGVYVARVSVAEKEFNGKLLIVNTRLCGSSFASNPLFRINGGNLTWTLYSTCSVSADNAPTYEFRALLITDEEFSQGDLLDVSDKRVVKNMNDCVKVVEYLQCRYKLFVDFLC